MEVRMGNGLWTEKRHNNGLANSYLPIMSVTFNGLANSDLPKRSETFKKKICLTAFAESEFGNPFFANRSSATHFCRIGVRQPVFSKFRLYL